jgi:hypothetical protein
LDRTGEMRDCTEWRILLRRNTTWYWVSSGFVPVFLPQRRSDQAVNDDWGRSIHL